MTSHRATARLLRLTAPDPAVARAPSLSVSNDLPAPPRRPRNAQDLIGRDAELDALRGLLDRGERLVTLSGGPGFGKSRLARALADALAREGAWSGGVFSVPLGGAEGVGLVEAVGLALGLPPAPDADQPAWLGPRLRELGPVLLVLDDVDRAIAATREALPTLLDDAPGLALVAVSREALGLASEVRFVLGPLPFDEGSGVTDAGAATSDPGPGPTAFAGDTAEHLFTLRAEAASPGCSRARGWTEGVRRLVRRLDGNPLALECAAVRMTILTPEALLARLDDRLALLAAPPGFGARGLWEALDDAWQALSAFEQRALARLSILEGPARLGALEAIVGDEPGAPMALELIDGLARKSLLARAPLGEGPAPRLFLFESVRSFARARYEGFPREAEDARDRLVAWCVGFAEAQGTDVMTPLTPAARLALVAEWDLLLGAARLASERPACAAAPSSAEAAARLLVGLGSVMRHIGAPSWVADLLRRLASGPHLSPHLRIRALLTRARVVALSSWRESARALDDAREIAHAIGDRHLEGIACYQRGQLVQAGDHAAVEASVRRGLELLEGREGSEGSGLDFPRAEARAWLAGVHAVRGDYATASALYAEAIPDIRRRGFVGLLARTLNNAGTVHCCIGDWAMAEACFLEALECAEADGDRVLACVIRPNLAECALRDGALEAARELFERGREAARELGYARVNGAATDYLAQIAFVDGELDEADELAEAAREPVARAWDDPAVLGLNGLVRAVIACARGKIAAAAEASAAADRELARVDHPVVLGVAAIHRAHLALLRGEVDGATARARAAAALEDHPDIRARRHELVFANGLLEATLARQAEAPAPARVEPPPPPAPPDATRFVIAGDGTWFSPPGGERVSLARKATARRVLAHLVAHREAETPLDVDGVFAAGWPGDRTPEPHRSNRAYVLIRRLRNAGLAPVLVHDGDGYRLDPTPGLVIAPPAPARH